MLRSADDAIGLRAFAQRPATRHAAIASGGLLGLERAAKILRDYREGLGLTFELEAESVDANGRLRGVNLTDGRRSPPEPTSARTSRAARGTVGVLAGE